MRMSAAFAVRLPNRPPVRLAAQAAPDRPPPAIGHCRPKGDAIMSLDPITLSVIQAGLQQVCDEMDLSFSRAAFSLVIAEANDRSDGIYAAEDGAELVRCGAGGGWHG